MVRWVGDSLGQDSRSVGAAPAIGLEQAIAQGFGTLPKLGAGVNNELVEIIKQNWAAAKSAAKSAVLASMGSGGPLALDVIGIISGMQQAHTEATYAHGCAACFRWYVSEDIYRAVLQDAASSTGVSFEQAIWEVSQTVNGKPGGVDMFGCPMYVHPGLRPGRFVLRLLLDPSVEGGNAP